MKRWMGLIVALLMAFTLVGEQRWQARAEAADTARGCRVDNYWGSCFDTLPKLHCCSAAFLGWSEIVVGDRFPVSGNMTQTEPFEPATALKISFPSGREVAIPVEPSGRFAEMVAFDEEGNYTLSRVEAGVDRGFGSFQVGYRAEFLDVPTVESQFGQQHFRSGVTLGVVEAGKPVDLKVRFTDAQGEPVRSRTLAIGRREQQIVTDAEGVALLTYEPESELYGYDIQRLYPGLGVISYRTITVDGNAMAQGLPGGEVAGYVQEGRIYLPLRDFLEKAAPMSLGDLPERILWNDEARAVEVSGLRIMIDTGMVLGAGDFRADLQVREGRTYMELDSLIRLLDRLGMASRTGEFSFRLSMAQEP